MKHLAPVLVPALLTFLIGCSFEPLEPPITDCDSDHSLVGSTADLETFFHGVSGTAVVVDNCTIEIQEFEYDGEGVDVHVVIADNEDFVDYTNLTEDLRPEGPYEGVTLTVPLREGMVLDGTTHVSIWCIPFAADFGSGTFVAPAGG